VARCGSSLFNTNANVTLNPMTTAGWNSLMSEFGPGSKTYQEFHGKPAPPSPAGKSKAIYVHGTTMYFGGALTNHFVKQQFFFKYNEYHKVICNKGF